MAVTSLSRLRPVEDPLAAPENRTHERHWSPVGRAGGSGRAARPFILCVGTLQADALAIALATDAIVIVVANAATAHAVLQSEEPDTEAALAAPTQVGVTQCGDLRVDRRRHEIRWRDCVVELSALEFDLLAALAADANRMRTFEELTREVWRAGYLGDTDLVLSGVKRLRRRLAGAAVDIKIASVRSRGFRLVVPA